MNRFVRRAPAPIVLALVVLLGCFGAAAGKKKSKAPPIFDPDSTYPQAPALEGQTWTQQGTAWTIRLTRVNDGQRQAFLRRATGFATDPFAPPRPDVPARYISFVLEIENSGSSPLVFNPMHSWLSTNKKEFQSPMAVTDLSFSYRVAGREFPAAYYRIGQVLFETATNVAPGQSVSGLLVYRAIRPNTKSYRVDVQLSLPDGELARFSAPYRRRKSG